MPDENKDTAVAAHADENTKTVKLDNPVTLPGGRVVDTIVVRKPNSGALRGLALTDIFRLQTEAIQTILPRVTDPMLVKQEVQKLEPADLVALGSAVMSFLLPKADRADFLPE
ncbi:phage tail assembly protein [Comamonas testosteroni]|uniref:phage tail assembly protein n=1 Tax=Comamonas testosteroni TaxID=285 RepID=UPI0028E93281|nr:phage tail assembly protein [Comamonas testosteroni]